MHDDISSLQACLHSCIDPDRVVQDAGGITVQRYDKKFAQHFGTWPSPRHEPFPCLTAHIVLPIIP